MYRVECPQYSIRLEALGYLGTNCLHQPQVGRCLKTEAVAEFSGNFCQWTGFLHHPIHTTILTH